MQDGDEGVDIGITGGMSTIYDRGGEGGEVQGPTNAPTERVATLDRPEANRHGDRYRM